MPHTTSYSLKPNQETYNYIEDCKLWYVKTTAKPFKTFNSWPNQCTWQ